MTTVPNSSSPVMDDEEMMRLFKKFHMSPQELEH